MTEDENNHLLIPLPDGSLATARQKPSRVLSEMVEQTLALARQVPLFKIGDHEWCEPDYRQILIWARALDLEPEEVIRRLINERSLFWTWSGTGDSVKFSDPSPQESGGNHYRYENETTFQNGKLVSLNWDFDLLPLTVFEWVEGLDIEHLRIVTRPTRANPISQLRLSLPKLRTVDCDHLGIENLDLSQVPLLEVLSCGGNRLTQLDLSNVHSLQQLFCWENDLETIDLSKALNLTTLECSNNPLSDLNLSGLLSLEEVFCSECRLTCMNLSSLPKLRNLECWDNQLENLDLTGVPNLESLYCSGNRLRKLDIEDMSSLRSLDIKDNPISFLDARGTSLRCTEVACGVKGYHTITVKADDGTYYG
jgi:hypothetical protein